MKKSIRWFVAVATVGLTSSVTLWAQDRAQKPIQTANERDPGEEGKAAMGRDDALRQDAEAVARSTGLPLGKALQIVKLQDERGDLVSELRQEFRGRVAGISVEYEPEYTLVVRLKGAAEPNPRSLKLPSGSVPIRFITGAQSSKEEMVASYSSKVDQIKAIVPTVQDIGIDERTGEIALSVYAVGPAATAVKGKRDELVRLLGHPVRVDTVEAQASDSDVRGGAKVNENSGHCTSGFVVKNSAGTTGVTTAGHCEGVNTYYNPNGTSIPLTWTLEIRDADQDVEVHTSGFIERPEFYADVATPRVLTGRRLRSSTAVGDQVCHRGVTTGYSCGNVSKTDTQLTYTNACNGVTCAATWVTVGGNSGTACYGGDSGGSVFISQTAVGTMKGGPNTGTAKGQCAYFYYMSTDFLPSGWTLLYG